MKMGDLIKSKYLKGSDLEPAGSNGVEVIIKEFVYEDVSLDDKPEEIKPVMRFVGKDKGLVLNKTNLELLWHATHTGPTHDTDEVHGCRIRLFLDPTVTMMGKIVGGIRIKPEPTNASTGPVDEKPMSRDESLQAEADAQTHAPDAGGPEFDDDIPF